jgi:hypothetical protein
MGNEYHYLTVSAYVMNMVFNIIRKIIYFNLFYTDGIGVNVNIFVLL